MVGKVVQGLSSLFRNFWLEEEKKPKSHKLEVFSARKQSQRKKVFQLEKILLSVWFSFKVGTNVRSNTNTKKGYHAPPKGS